MSNVYLITIKEVQEDTVTARITSVQFPVFDFHENIPLQILLESFAYLSYGGTYFDPKPYSDNKDYDKLIENHPFKAEYQKWGLLNDTLDEKSLCTLSEELIQILSYDYENTADPSYCDLKFKVNNKNMLYHLSTNLHWGSAMYDAS